MFAMECVWATAGRYMMVASAETSVGWFIITLIAAGYMEWFMRINAEAIKNNVNRIMYGKPPLTGRALKNYRIAEACSQAQDNAVELGAIVITGLSFYALFPMRGALGLGFGDVQPDLSHLLLVVIGLQLLIEMATDTVTSAQVSTTCTVFVLLKLACLMLQFVRFLHHQRKYSNTLLVSLLFFSLLLTPAAY